MAGHLDSEYVSQEAAGLSALLIPSAADNQLEDPDIQVSVQVPKSYQTTILNNHHEKFRKSLNFRSVLPLLNQDGLIPYEEYRELMKVQQTDTNHDRIDRLFAIIPSCGRDDFLVRLINCLRESVQDAGEAHKELADSLQEALNSYIPVPSDSPSRQDENVNINKEGGNEFEIVDPESALIVEGHGGGRSILNVECPNDREHSRQGRCGCCFWSSCYFIFIALLVLGIIGLVSLSQLPHSTSTPPFVLPRKSRSLTVVEFGLDSHWISTVHVRLDSSPECFGTIHIIPSRTCNSLPTQTEQLTFYNLMYLLAGSQIIILVKPTFQGRTVWVVSSISAYHYAKKNPILTDDCSDLTTDIMQDYSCFEADKYNTTNPIVFNVERSDYYSLFVTDLFTGGFSGLAYSVQTRTYNLTEINRISRPRSIEVKPGSTQQFYVNIPWKFSRDPLCVLFESSCVSQNVITDTNLTVLAVQKRRDVLLFHLFLRFVPFSF